MNDGIDQIIYATNQKAEEYAKAQWMAAWQHYMTFDEYKEKTGFKHLSLTGTSNKSETEILNEVKDILDNMEW